MTDPFSSPMVFIPRKSSASAFHIGECHVTIGEYMDWLTRLRREQKFCALIETSHQSGLDAILAWEKTQETAKKLASKILNERAQSELPMLRIWEIYDPELPKGFAASDNQPIVCVNHGGMVAYCADFSQGGRLPTEFEIERTARGESGNQEYATRDGKKPSTKQACYGGDCTIPVGSFRGNYVSWNGKEICDLGGLVWDATSTLSVWDDNNYKFLRDGSKNISELKQSEYQIVCGGSYYDDVNSVCSAARFVVNRHLRFHNSIGFRVLVPSQKLS